MKKSSEKSIRSQLLGWLLIPLCTIWCIIACAGYLIADKFANDTFDRELLNTADSVIARLRSDHFKVWVDLPPAAQAILRHNDRDKVYFQVLTRDLRRICGDAILPKPIGPLDASEPRFRNSILNGQDVRMVRIKVDVPNVSEQSLLVQVAQTLNSRREMTHHILLSIVLPQMILIILGAFSVSFGVTRGLKPLKTLESDLSKRSQFDLTPIASDDTPREVRPLVNSINDLLERLRDDIEHQHRFVANAAHQFRTPLAGLKTFIYAAKRLPSEEKMKSVLDKIEAGTDRMTHLANKLLILAKAEPVSSVERHYECLDLNFIASEATSEFVSESVPRNVELCFIGSDKPAMIYGEMADLTELTSNLIENAVIYTHEGGSVTVRVSNGDAVRLTVQDNGPGIPEDERNRVFERFYRILGTEAPGSGLGLPIVKEIAAAHRAKVSIESGTLGIGTCVTVTFPLPDGKDLN